MNDLQKLYKRLEQLPMSAIAARPGFHLPEVISKMIITYGLEEKKKVTILMDDEENWLTIHLLNAMLDVDLETIYNYLSPLKFTKQPQSIDAKLFVEALEKLCASGITFQSVKKYRKEYIDSLLNEESEKEEHPDIMIIYYAEYLLKNDSYSPREIFDKLHTLTEYGTHVIMVCKVERAAEEAPVQNFRHIHNYNDLKEYVDETVLVHNFRRDGFNDTMTITTEEGEFDITYDRKTDKLR